MRILWINSIVTPERNEIPLWNHRLAAPPKVPNLCEFSYSVIFFFPCKHFIPKALPAGITVPSDLQLGNSVLFLCSRGNIHQE